ncbi:Hsp70 family protein [Nocardia sp. NPDC052254]|uniref:Hsp70 family protein n=1 Tax=Nocardia sp. NPDC052254 TaxID=3155681 RepID=UPI003442F9F3
MTQGQTLGITVGSSRTIAATGSASAGAHPEDVSVHIGRQRLPPVPELSENLLTRVGDPVGILLPDGSTVAAADLVAETINQVVADFSPVSTVATVPAWWSAGAVESQRQALARAGSESVVLVPEPLAALRRLQAGAAVPDDTVVVVHDLGASGTTVSVVRTGAGPGLLVDCVRSTEISGTEFDLSIMRYVLANVVGERDFDPFDPVVERELSILRNRCAAAKHHLSRNTATTIQVRLAGIARDVRLVRDEVEELLRGPMTDSVGLVHEVARRAGVGSDKIGRILLTGGGASIGLLTELISAEFTAPLAPIDDPVSLSTRGAVLLAADLLTESRTAAGGPTRTAAGTPAPPISSDKIDTVALAALGGRGTIEPPPAESAMRTSSGGRRRVLFLAGAALAVGVLATGTLALGTTGAPAPTSATSPAATTSTVRAAAADSASPAVAENVAANTTGAVHADTGANTVAAPASAAPASNAPGPGTAAPNTPVGVAAPAPDQPDAPAPAAPAANSPAPNSPPAQSPPPVTQSPTAPAQSGTSPGSRLGNTLNNGLDQVGNTVGTVLQVPGKIRPHEGN